MASYEKLPMQPQLPNVATMPVKKSASSRRRRLLLCGIATTLATGYYASTRFSLPSLGCHHHHGGSVPDFKAQCPQVEPIQPKHQTQALSDMESYFSTVKFRNESVARLSGAVKIPSESYDDLGPVGEDKRWDTMYDVAAYLKATFPAVHEYLELEKVNTHGLLFTWKGSDPSLKPTVLMAHQDVVPVAQATVSQWTHPPYSGHYDGAYVWGRGASDCKNTLVGILEAVEMLINAGFTPKRTLILSFGFDEESSGREGAGHLSNTLMERYGKDGVAMIVDEGSGNVPTFGTYFAVPAVAEKGYIDVDVIVRMPGGHSSIPPPHTGIGVMSEFITMIESNPYEPHIADENPFMNILQCGAAYGPEFPDDWKKLMPSGHHTGAKKDKLARAVAEASRPMKYLFTTSVAVDVVGGGVKANALPERTTALVNHRINIGSSSADIKKHLTKLASKLADKYDLAVNAFEGDETQSSITLRASNNTLEPAPITPTETDSLNPFVLLSGTIKALYGDKLQISPALMTGNTDTRYYWGLSKHIFRYIPGWDPEEAGNLDGVHTVDERVSVTGHVNGVKWFTLFIRNIDEAELP